MNNIRSSIRSSSAWSSSLASTSRQGRSDNRYLVIRDFFNRQVSTGRVPFPSVSREELGAGLRMDRRLNLIDHASRSWRALGMTRKSSSLSNNPRRTLKTSLGFAEYRQSTSFSTRRFISSETGHWVGTRERLKLSDSLGVARRFNSSRTSFYTQRFNSTKSTPEKCPDCDRITHNNLLTSTSTSASASTPSAQSQAKRDLPHHAQEYIPFIRRLIRRSSSLAAATNRRPSKEELLAAAESWWQRFRIRLKWFTIRGWRRFNMDDMSAFFSWFLVGNTLWIVIGTTTFVSAVFATLNSLSLQEYVARWISDYLTSETGVTVIFESAIVPRWGASTISFRNVYISRRPRDEIKNENEAIDQNMSSPPQPLKKPQTKASTATPPSPIPFLSSSIEPDTYLNVPKAKEEENYTMFDINLEEVEVTLSLMRWLDGKGLVKDAKVKGVRGVIDRRSVWWDQTKRLIPAEFRHATRPGDFELESFQVEDFLVTVYQPGGQRPYNVSIFNASLGPFRKRWLFYDIISAEGMTGQFDNCLFSLHMPQKLSKSTENETMVKRMARLRIDGLPIEHVQYATGHTGPISWITSGKLDAVLDIRFPPHPDDEVDIKAIFEEISRKVANITQHGTHPDHETDRSADPTITNTITSQTTSTSPTVTIPTTPQDNARQQISDTIAATEASQSKMLPGQHRLARPPLTPPSQEGGEVGIGGSGEEAEGRKVTIDIDLRFRDLKAAVPVFTADLSVTNNALIRPIVAFINANRTLVPIHCRVAADLTEFDGSWTLFETGLMSSISNQVYAALAHHVSSEAANSKRLRQVSFWGIQRSAEVLIDTLKTVVDPIHAAVPAAV